MQVSVETTSTLGRRLTVVVPADQFEQEFTHRLERLSRQVKMPGFRPGKVPAKVVEARYRGQLLEETAGDLIERTLREAIGSHELRPAGGTRISHKPLARGQGLEYTAEFEIYPEIKHLDLAGAEIERPAATIADADIDRTVESIRRQRVTYRAVERAAAQGDRLLVDFVARADGSEIEGGKAENQAMVLGSGSSFRELEEGMVGAAGGETRRIVVNFPAEARNPAVAGKAIEFEVRVREIAESVLPEVNEDLAKTLGVTEGGVERLRQEIRGSLEREAAERTRTVLRRNVLKKLRELNQFDVPAGLIENEVERMKRLSQASGQAVDSSQDAHYRERARMRVALGLILAEIVRVRGIKADPARVRARVEQMARDYESPQKFIEWYYANPERLGEIESTILEDMVVEQLLGSAQVRDRTVAFSDLLQMDVSIE